ncbi:PQQ-dependent dehydrogenase, methanol/ethanol family [Nitratireductor sp. StC3]|uniref:PQQ-dependent dehydrogenase, methanol/ethanol family n=1 Tax=Nitratireductor sp. StC3 TaxID=2126741 RepID=UPI000D0D0C50|nr:PQQ-dependent dehydrogenase, methanol/ethanol family [Nitratireductor sp. StC3]PSM16788.1 PQQ-dependent dehydrogenase, methanol/ethanol family [Nitratireductor sp. StC3]
MPRPIALAARAVLAGATCAILATTLAAQELTPDAITEAVSAVDTAAIIANRDETRNWPTHGLDYQETRHSKLKGITVDNVSRLGLAWSADLQSRRGVEATPIVVDGVMYVTASWSVVHAFDAVTGEKLWRYDPEVPKDYAYKGCCDVINRGVAVYEGKVFVAAYDGYLHAIDAATGARAWKTDTIENRAMSYTITGAPRVYKGMVMIGNGGAEYGVRGYITAYDAATGAEKWRWYSVPGDPSKPFEDDSMKAAAETWDPAGKWWEAGGGGTMWDSMAFDPELDLMYVGTGNGSPWNRNLRSPAGGDNLYLASVVALNPNTGDYVCHYQETPGDNWDYTSTQHIILADLQIDGQARKVWLHAPKNGFFYVVDRTDCGFISAEKFVEVDWATGYDDNGRPIEVEGARSRTDPWETVPSPYGAHNWHPMSFNPETGLVYIPAQGVPLVTQHNPDWKLNTHVPGAAMSNLGWNLGYLFNTVAPQATPFGHLLAWDPVDQKEVWRANYVSPWNGGTLTTAGGLVFQGTADGRFVAYDAKTGDMLWQTPVGTGVVAAPATWEKDGVQYVTIAVGWGGVYGQMQRATEKTGPGRVYTFMLEGKAAMPPMIEREPATLVSGVPYDPEDIGPGAALYVSSCLFCHGVPGVNNGGNIPNLGFSSADTLNNAAELLLTGAFVEGGMPSFEGKLTEADVNKIVAFIQGTADAVRPK